MKHLITLAIALITAATLSSCGVTTTITYGDISVLDLNGKQIRQWDNCTMDVSVKDNYSGQNLQKTYAIKNGGGLAFTDDSGESHYVAGGVIIVDNIRTTVNGSTPSEFEYKQLKKEYEHVSKLLLTHLRGGRGPGRMEEEQYDRMVAKKEYLEKRISIIESKMNDN